MRTHLLNTLLIAGIAGLSFASSTASASVVFINGNNPQPGEQNVLFITGTGTTVSGLTNMSGTLGTFTDNFPGGPGENFVTILAQGNETISSVAFTSSAGFGTFDQPRISGIASAVPEPSTWAMMLLGFAGLGFAFRHSRRKVSFA